MKKVIVAITVMVVIIVLQFFVRYEVVKVGPIDLKRDKLTGVIYMRSEKDKDWSKSRFDDLQKAKVYYQRTGWDHILY